MIRFEAWSDQDWSFESIELELGVEFGVIGLERIGAGVRRRKDRKFQ